MYRCLSEPRTDRQTDTDKQTDGQTDRYRQTKLTFLKEFLLNMFRLIKKTNKQTKKGKPLNFL